MANELRIFYVQWVNYYGNYRSMVITCTSKAQAKRIVVQAYSGATKIKVRKLDG